MRRALAERGHGVIGVDLPGRGAEIEQDLADPGLDAGALARRVGPVGGIIHLAARITRGSSVDAGARRNLRAIAEAPVLLSEAWRAQHGPLHVVFCSTLKVYGAGIRGAIDPVATPLHPEPRSYGCAKALAERLLATAARRAGFSLAVVRPTYIYGTGQAAHNAIPIFLAACWRGEPPVVFGERGQELRDDVHVSEVAASLVAACLRRAEGPFNSAGERVRTLIEVAQLCCDAVAAAGGPAGLHPLCDPNLPPKPWVDQSFDATRTHDLLGVTATPMLARLTEQAAAMRTS